MTVSIAYRISDMEQDDLQTYLFLQWLYADRIQVESVNLYQARHLSGLVTWLSVVKGERSTSSIDFRAK